MLFLKALIEDKNVTFSDDFYIWARKMGTSIYALRVLWVCDIGIMPLLTRTQRLTSW